MLGEGGSCAREGGSSAGEGGSSSWGGQWPLVFNFLALKKPVTPNNINNRSAFALSVICKVIKLLNITIVYNVYEFLTN